VGVSNAEFHGLSFNYEKVGSLHYLEAKKDGEVVGKLNWVHPSGNISGIHVNKENRRTGIATAMFNEGTRLSETRGIPKPKITNDRTYDGEAWSKSLGIRLPRNKNL
jgi:predicted acetyltransferase